MPASSRIFAIATPAGGHPIVELVGASTVSLRELVNDAWQALGSDLTLASPVSGEAALASPASGKAVVGWVDNAAELRVYRYDGSGWDTMEDRGGATANRHVPC